MTPKHLAHTRRCLAHRQIAAIVLLAIVTATLAEARAERPDFERDIAPLIAKRCLECHNARDAKGGLNLTSRAGLEKGGESGPAMIAGDAAASNLIERVAAGEMPPATGGQARPLPKQELVLLRQWVDAGATWPAGRTLSLYESTTDVRAGLNWWSLQPVRRPEIPAVESQDRLANPIDAFVLARLEQQDMEPAPPAPRQILLRRAYFDLIGLPPTPAEMAAYLNDPAPNAFEQVVDRLLASKHYGERWARYWLDLVRFAETCGYERDQLKPGIWRYRDWVIDALNNDMSYDRFVAHQLAGDEVPDRDERSVIATGMLRAGTWNDEPNDAADYLYERLEDMVHTTCSAFLGLTVKCARCHDHKFDPIRQTDYYRTASFFWVGYIGQANLGGPNQEQLGANVFGWTDRARQAEPIRLLHQGERSRPGPVVEPGFLSAIPALDLPLRSPPPDSRTTHRRLQLAQWITDQRNPLTARVLVNRLWLHHFGEGLVRTPNNFGFKSDPPTHPRLLDWLAAEFVAGDWKLKRMHKLIMMSNTYRQSSQHPRQAEYAQRDFLNRSLWRAHRRRLDAEALRDAMLAASGRLNPAMGGPSFYPRMSAEALEGLSRKGKAWSQSPDSQRARRSIYMMTKRSRLLPLMTTFDFGNTNLPCGQRDVTVVAPQALALLNNAFVHEQSEAFAQRLVGPGKPTLAHQIEQAWRIALGRAPRSDERTQAAAHVQAQREHFRAVLAATGDLDEREASSELALNAKPVLWLRADQGVETDPQDRVMFWRDAAAAGQVGLHPHDASQADAARRPRLVTDAVASQPAIRFDGQSQFMHLAGQILWSPQFSLFAVANHRATSGGAREIFSNWHRKGRSTSSVFLGTTGQRGLRFTDAMPNAGELADPQTPFLLTAVNGAAAALTFQNQRKLNSAAPLTGRDLRGPYVIGTQGNYNAEWWHGDIAEILVYDRALNEVERQGVERYLAGKYSLPDRPPARRDANLLALASLCHVLLNTNEFIFVD